MCGIVGAVGSNNLKKYLIEGLKSLEYRGYDSAGIGYLKDDQILITKVVGRIQQLEQATPSLDDINIGMGHTRWATHGVPNLSNAHPHKSNNNLVSVVHNGVIFNYRELAKKLTDLGYQFYSQTDTEVLANLIEYYYVTTKDILTAISSMMEQCQGSYALAILVNEDVDHLYFAKNKSPLMIGSSQTSHYLGSDYWPMLEYCQQFYQIDDLQYGYIKKDGVLVKQLGQTEPLQISFHSSDLSIKQAELNGYPHFMLKEIEEAPVIVSNIIDNYYDDRYLFDDQVINKIKQSDQIIFLGCGTSYHAALIGAFYFNQRGFNAIAYIASEWGYYPLVFGKNPLFILISQSGETADLLRCVDYIKQNDWPIITITNTKGSLLDRQSNHTLLLYAGLEVAVASTKAFIAQVSLLAILGAATRNDQSLIKSLRQTQKLMPSLKKQLTKVKKVARQIAKHKNIYFLGRGLDYFLALEASLKLKETSYIHSEAIPSGELKHGSIALIDKGTPTILFISDPETSLAIRGNSQELLARGAHVIIISNAKVSFATDDLILKDNDPDLAIILKTVIAQYLAYYVAKILKRDIDKPRNLAKAVTVE